MKITETLRTFFSRHADAEEGYGEWLAENAESYGRDPQQDHLNVHTAQELSRNTAQNTEKSDSLPHPLALGI